MVTLICNFVAKIFDLVNNNVVVNPEVLTVPQFSTIWSKDKTKDKVNAFKAFTYVYHMSDWNSPYANFPQKKREEVVKTDCMGDSLYTPTQEVIDAINKYKELQETPLQRLLQSAKNKVDDIATYMESTSIDDDNIKIILDAFSKISTTISNFDKLQQAVQKEKEQANVHVRGNKDINTDFNE